MKTPGYVHLLLTLFVCVAAHRARAADAEIWLVGNDQDALQIAQQVLSNKGLGVTYARGNDVPPGVYATSSRTRNRQLRIARADTGEELPKGVE
jgi:hypothetical protein